jgi:opacity protein-like surface antigen
MTNKKTLKTIVFSLGLAAMTLTANNMNAQNDGSRGMFGRGASFESAEQGSKTLFRNDYVNRGDASISGGIANDDFGAPLGSGIAILIGAGLGYVALKKKED